jgi:hypothetical protein
MVDHSLSTMNRKGKRDIYVAAIILIVSVVSMIAFARL